MSLVNRMLGQNRNNSTTKSMAYRHEAVFIIIIHVNLLFYNFVYNMLNFTKINL